MAGANPGWHLLSDIYACFVSQVMMVDVCSVCWLLTDNCSPHVFRPNSRGFVFQC